MVDSYRTEILRELTEDGELLVATKVIQGMSDQVMVEIALLELDADGEGSVDTIVVTEKLLRSLTAALDGTASLLSPVWVEIDKDALKGVPMSEKIRVMTEDGHLLMVGRMNSLGSHGDTVTDVSFREEGLFAQRTLRYGLETFDSVRFQRLSIKLG